MSEHPVIYVDIYRTRGKKVTASQPGFRAQAWRWRAVNADNNRKMATSGEAYTNRQDCLDAITALFGMGTTVYQREAEHMDNLVRFALKAVPT